MPEALIAFAVFVITIIVYVVAWIQSRDPKHYDARQERERLQHHHVWLEQRLHRARRENWGDEMIARCAHELEATAQQLAKLGTTNAAAAAR